MNVGIVSVGWTLGDTQCDWIGQKTKETINSTGKQLGINGVVLVCGNQTLMSPTRLTLDNVTLTCCKYFLLYFSYLSL